MCTCLCFSFVWRFSPKDVNLQIIHIDIILNVSFIISITGKKKRAKTQDERCKFREAKHPLLPHCSAGNKDHCQRRCHLVVSEGDRVATHALFWQSDYTAQKLFLHGHIETVLNMDRHISTYYLTTIGGIRHNVCKVMFLRTLGYKSDKVVTLFVKSRFNNPDTFTIDNRGKNATVNKIDTAPIIAHIASYNPEQSHYRREHAPHRRYLPSHLTIVSMYNDYKEKVGADTAPCYETFRKVFKGQKITFGRPPVDECPQCLIHKNHKRARENNLDQGCEDDCEDCRQALEHIELITAARNMIREDAKNIPDDTDVFTVDMQKVILIPKLTTKEHFFTPRLIAYNETFARLSSGTDLCVLWHEAVSGRDAAQVASAYIKAVKSSGKKHIKLWCDNCNSQNKNWTLYTAMVICVNQPDGPESISIRYLETGHTTMRADSIHGSIGRKLKKESTIVSFDDLSQLCDQAAHNIEVVNLVHSDFYEFKNYARANTKKIIKPLLKEVKEVKFTKGKFSLECKEGSFESNFREVAFIAPKFKKQKKLKSMPATHPQSRGISTKKRDGIVHLLRTNTTCDSNSFYFNIPLNDASPDLYTEDMLSVAEGPLSDDDS